MRRTSNKYIPFSYKMMIPYLLLVLLTEAVIGYFSYHTALKSRTELVEANVGWALRQMSETIRYKMEDLQAVSDSLFSSPSFQKYLQVTGSDVDIYETTTGRLIPFMETAVRMSTQEHRLIVYMNNRQLNEIYGNLYGPIEEKSYHFLSMNRIAGQAWFNELAKTHTDNVWLQVEKDKDEGNISLVRKLISFDDYRTEIGYLRLSVPVEKMLMPAESMHLDDQMTMRVVDERDQSVLIQQQPSGGGTHEVRYLRIRQTIPGTSFALEARVPQSALVAEAGKLSRITLLVCGISFLVIAFIAVTVARYSDRRISRILMYVHAFGLGRFNHRIPTAGKDEFAQISSAFNRMAQRIDELIREVYIQGLQKKEKEIEALQAQINPHFLYNTLSSINSLANIGETEKVSSMVMALTTFYRLTLNNGEMVIRLKDEIHQVRAYLDIQAIKYANRFTVSYEIDSEVENSRTIKLILQPFVENIFKHAWYDERIHIKITAARAGKTIVLKIIDNGIGMTRHPLERMDRMDSLSPEEGGYGIRNVQERIRLHYGEGYGVSIRSRLGFGTAVQIVLPYRVEADRKGDDENGLQSLDRG